MTINDRLDAIMRAHRNDSPYDRLAINDDVPGLVAALRAAIAECEYVDVWDAGEYDRGRMDALDSVLTKIKVVFND